MKRMTILVAVSFLLIIASIAGERIQANDSILVDPGNLLSQGITPDETSSEQPPPLPPGGNENRFREKFFEKIKLTDAQRAKFMEIRMKYEDMAEDIVLDLQKARLQMVELLRSDNPDRKKIDQSLNQILYLEKKRQKLLVDEYFETRNILNPEQRRQLARMMVRMLLRGK